MGIMCTVKKIKILFNKIKALEACQRRHSEGYYFNITKRDAFEQKLRVANEEHDRLLKTLTKEQYEEHFECGYGIPYEEFIE